MAKKIIRKKKMKSLGVRDIPVETLIKELEKHSDKEAFVSTYVRGDIYNMETGIKIYWYE